MAGYETPLSVPYGGGSLLSSADISGGEGLWGVITTNTVAKATTVATGHGIITQGGAASGDPVRVCVGWVKAIAGDTVAAGDPVTNEATTARTIAVGATHVARGVALTGGADGEVIDLFVFGDTTTGT